MSKNFYMLVQCGVTVIVSTLISPICDYLNSNYCWNKMLIAFIISIILIGILYAVQMKMNDSDEFGRFSKFVDSLNEKFERIDSYHKEINSSLLSNSNLQKNINKLLSRMNNQHSQVIRRDLQELEEVVSKKISKFNEEYSNKVYKASKEKFGSELEDIFNYLINKFHKIETYIDEQNNSGEEYNSEESSGF